MGLFISHGAWPRGTYSAFNRFREVLCEVTGGSWPKSSGIAPVMTWYWGPNYSPETHPGLFALLSHSDCDGDIAPDLCTHLANELEALLPLLDGQGEGVGHIADRGGYGGIARDLIAGGRDAAAHNEYLYFS